MNLYVYIYTHIYIYTYNYMHVFIIHTTRTHAHTHTRTHTHTHTHTHIHIHTSGCLGTLWKKKKDTLLALLKALLRLYNTIKALLREGSAKGRLI
jgi:hypothetical protein